MRKFIYRSVSVIVVVVVGLSLIVCFRGFGTVGGMPCVGIPEAFIERLTFWAFEFLGERHLGEIAVLWL